jgi:hypothetical protein
MKTAKVVSIGLWLLMAAAAARAQPVVTPTPGRPDEIATKAAYTVSARAILRKNFQLEEQAKFSLYNDDRCG